VIAQRVEGGPMPPHFRYHDLGSMAIVGRGFAVLLRGRLKMAGFLAWLAWALVHINQLAAFMNRLRVMVQWAWAYCTRQHGSRLIVERRVPVGLSTPPTVKEESPKPQGESSSPRA
jgi:NADH dehydrogenase